MNTMSISLTLGKASSPHGANLAHNNRDFISDNVDKSRILDNITYANQDIAVAYDELFSESLEAYNAKQKVTIQSPHQSTAVSRQTIQIYYPLHSIHA
jgi:hypothetical protein